MHPGDVFNAKVLRSVHGYPRIGLCKRNSFGRKNNPIIRRALTSTERIWRHTRHVRFGSETDIRSTSNHCLLCPQSGHWRSYSKFLVYRCALECDLNHWVFDPSNGPSERDVYDVLAFVSASESVPFFRYLGFSFYITIPPDAPGLKRRCACFRLRE